MSEPLSLREGGREGGGGGGGVIGSFGCGYDFSEHDCHERECLSFLIIS